MSSSSYWCYRCNRLVRVPATSTAVSCPDCSGGFIEAIENPNSDNNNSGESRRRFPAATMYMTRRRPAGDRSPFNPVVVLRGAAEGRGFELFYDDGGGSGLRPVPASMSEVLLGSGFDRVLNHISQVELTSGGSRDDNSPASKAAIESMLARVEIGEDRVHGDFQCSICKDVFEFGAEAREMPCKHVYHSECILPWLSRRNSCPLCRYELPPDTHAPSEDERVGMTIWRLPGGGFAVGRFSDHVPVVYTEVDGGFGGVAPARRVSWSGRGGGGAGGGGGGGFGRVLRGMFACFGNRVVSGTNSAPVEPRRRRTWSMDVNSGGVSRW